MKKTILLFMLVWSLSASSQELSESAYWRAEMEDSLSSLAIKPIKHPANVLNKIVNKVLEDWEQKPKACKYRIEETDYINTPSMYTVKAIIHADANVWLEPTKLEELTNEGPSKMTRGDSATIRLTFMAFAESGTILNLIDYASWSNKITKHYAFKQLMRAYHIKVYSISDASGRGVYRVDFSPKKKRNEDFSWRYDLHSFTGTAYFDSKTFNVTQVKVDNVQNGSSFISKRPSEKSTTPSAPRLRVRYHIDFDVIGGMSVVKRIRRAIFNDNKLTSKDTIQRIE